MSFELVKVMMPASAMAFSIFREAPEKRCLDLSDSEKDLAGDLYAATKRGDKAKRSAATERIINRMIQLLDGIDSTGTTTSAKLKVLAKVINFNAVLRENGVTPADITSYMLPDRTARRSTMMNFQMLWDWAVETTIEDIERFAKKGDVGAGQFLVMMDIEKGKGVTYRQYLKNNLRSIIFVSKMNEHVKIFKGDAYWGAEEEISRTGVFDTYSEQGNERRETWLMVGYLVHGAAHMEYFHDPKIASDPSAISLAKNETFAYTRQLEYYKALLKASLRKNSGITLSNAQTNDLNRNILYIEDKLKRQDFQPK